MRPLPAKRARRHSEVSTERAGERLMILIAAFQGDFQYRRPADAQLDRRPFEAQAIHVRFRRFARHFVKDLVKVVLGKLSFIGQSIKRQVLIQVRLNMNERGNNPSKGWSSVEPAHDQSLSPMARIVKNSSIFEIILS